MSFRLIGPNSRFPITSVALFDSFFTFRLATVATARFVTQPVTLDSMLIC